MEIAIAGPGEVVIRFIDSKGRTLLQEKLTVSGSATVEGRRTIGLSVMTGSGRTPVAPVLARQSHPKQRVTFDGENPGGSCRKFLAISARTSPSFTSTHAKASCC